MQYPSAEFAELINNGLEEVELRLRDSVVGARGLVDELTAHLAGAGGKRMRPALVLLCAQLGRTGETVPEPILTACVVVELTHIATLYHDDVMDSAPTRRGAPAAQHLWGNNRAILAGDVLFARASTRVVTLGPDAVLQHAKTFERLCLGQLNESFGPRENDDPVEFYLQVLADKTGSLVAQSARYGAELSGASKEVADVVANFGERIGVAFQIADDVIDLTSKAEDSGKTPGTDLREGVDTMPVLLLKRQQREGTIDTAGREILAALKQDLSSDEALAQVVAKLAAHPVLQQTRQLAQDWADSAKTQLLEGLPASQARDALVAFADMLVDRIS